MSAGVPSYTSIFAPSLALTNLKSVKVAALKKGGQIGTTFPSRFLLTAIIALATAWSAASPFGPILDPDSRKHPAALRRNIAEAVGLLSKAKAGG